MSNALLTYHHAFYPDKVMVDGERFDKNSNIVTEIGYEPIGDRWKITIVYKDLSGTSKGRTQLNTLVMYADDIKAVFETPRFRKPKDKLNVYISTGEQSQNGEKKD